MKIDWQPNPLRSRIILDEQDKKILRLRVLLQETQERSGWVGHYLEEGDRFDLVKARKAWDHLDDEGSLGNRVELLYNFYLGVADSRHCGDCTCVPASCAKCSLEELLDICTIPNGSKYLFNHINIAFGKVSDGPVSIDEAIDKLNTYLPPASSGAFVSMAETWEKQARAAAAWLTQYRDDHFPKER